MGCSWLICHCKHRYIPGYRMGCKTLSLKVLVLGYLKNSGGDPLTKCDGVLPQAAINTQILTN